MPNRKGISRWMWAAAMLPSSLLLLPLWPLLLIAAIVESRPLRAWVARARHAYQHRQGLGSRAMKYASVGLLLLVLTGLCGLWLYSHLDSAAFGSCHEVPLTIGKTPSVSECQPYGPSDFTVPFGVALFLLLLLLGREMSIPTP
jgi:hypothetical protein